MKRTEKQIAAIVEDAQAAFWQAVAAACPDIPGDFPPLAFVQFADACDAAVRRWLCYNTPVPTAVATTPIACHYCGTDADGVAMLAAYWSKVGDAVTDPYCCEVSHLEDNDHA